MFKKSLLVLSLFALLVFCLPAAAQQPKDDSLRLRRDYMTQQAALRYPALRMATVQMETTGGTHYTSRLRGKDFEKGRIQPQSTLKATFSLPVYTSGSQELSVISAYTLQATTLKNTINQIPQSRVSDGTYTLQNLSLALNYKRTDSLFNKPVLWGGMLLMNFSLQSSLARATGLLYGMVPLKTTRTTRIFAGLLVFIDPSSTVPVIPTFSYWHKFAGSPWEISLDLPTRLLLRRPVFSKGLLSFGSELADHTLLRKSDQPLLQGGFAFKNLDLKSGVTLEYPVSRKVLIGCSGGLLYTTQYRVLDPSKSINDYTVGIKRNPGPYLNINLSLLR
ncbi:MAG TPA: hypothetical protein VNS58_23705 [Puia sp.]|nr:hypothetical protein [Puia sp.]